MTWKIEFTAQAAKQFEALDKPIRQRVGKFLMQRLATLDNPRVLGKPLHGPLSDFWSYRVGDYRILAQIEDEHLVILLTELSHRRSVYKS